MGPHQGIWPVFRDGKEPLQVASRTRLRSNGKLARPYIWRLSILSRLTLPSTTPETPGQGEPVDHGVVVVPEIAGEGVQVGLVVGLEPR